MVDPFIYLGYFLLYTIVILYLGKYGFDRSETVKEYYLANQSLGLFVSIATFSATWLSAASMLGLPGLIYQYGYSAILYSVVCWFLGAVLLVVMARKLRAYDVVTIPEFFYKRYHSRSLQIGTGIILVITYVLYIAIQIRGFGIVVSYMLDIPFSVAALLVFLFLIYTTYGGLYSVARTDVFNFFLIILGTCMAAFLILQETGGWANVHIDIVRLTEGSENDWFHPFYYGNASLFVFISSFLSLGLGLAANPQYAIRLLSTTSTKHAIRMVSVSVLLLGFLYLALIIIGIGSISLLSAEGQLPADEVFPYIIHDIITSPLKGVILMSIVAACISTANSQLLLLSSSFVYDVYQRFSKKRERSEAEIIGMNKWMITLLALLSLLISQQPFESLLYFSGQVWGVIAVSFFFPLYGGLFMKKASKRGSWGSIVVGLLTYVTWGVFTPAEWQTVIQPVVPALLFAAIAFWLLRDHHE
ncbi:sodium:solute symporter family protein [Desertibacillus haloalkaliphilus]|uniref:sodium:solute symporter family protein n=1 Tax=Desertibacillus haloalkaliphilus TaxID=1328930 RepID=UPI001C27027D|nr:sodium:solute symporter family protein [Desertibacillus haloalkaliphilus]MBU8907541.1 sodium:solute symporter family protein [Desertibacillus haloalkaliphilus]